LFLPIAESEMKTFTEKKNNLALSLETLPGQAEEQFVFLAF
jgi:hypothetical protein